MPSNRLHGCIAAPLFGLSLWALLTASPVTATTEQSNSSGIGPMARGEIKIALSVRPTVAVRRTVVVSKDGRRRPSKSFCFWSNSPMSRYSVTIEVQHVVGPSNSRAVFQGENLECLTHGPAVTLLNRLEESGIEDEQLPNVVNLIISPE